MIVFGRNQWRRHKERSSDIEEKEKVNGVSTPPSPRATQSLPSITSDETNESEQADSTGNAETSIDSKAVDTEL